VRTPLVVSNSPGRPQGLSGSNIVKNLAARELVPVQTEILRDDEASSIQWFV